MIERYGRAKLSTLRRDFDALRAAVSSHDTFATEAAWEKCERWLGAIEPSERLAELEAENARLRARLADKVYD